MRYLLEIIIAVLAVYGGYTALHELMALLKKYIVREKNEKRPKEGGESHSERKRNNERKERRSRRARRRD